MPVFSTSFLINVQWTFQDFPRQQRWHKDAPTRFTRHLIRDITSSAGVELRVRLLHWLRHYTHIFNFVVLAVVRKLVLRERQLQNVNRLVVTRTALFERQRGRPEKPSVS